MVHIAPEVALGNGNEKNFSLISAFGPAGLERVRVGGGFPVWVDTCVGFCVWDSSLGNVLHKLSI